MHVAWAMYALMAQCIYAPDTVCHFNYFFKYLIDYSGEAPI